MKALIDKIELRGYTLNVLFAIVNFLLLTFQCMFFSKLQFIVTPYNPSPDIFLSFLFFRNLCQNKNFPNKQSSFRIFSIFDRSMCRSCLNCDSSRLIWSDNVLVQLTIFDCWSVWLLLNSNNYLNTLV